MIRRPPRSPLFPYTTLSRSLALPTRHVFTVTTVLIALLAAGMAAQAVHFLDAAGLIDVLGNRMWDSSGVLPENSLIGRLLHRSEEHTSELQSQSNLVCRLLL